MFDLLLIISALLSPFVPAAAGVTPRARHTRGGAPGRHRAPRKLSLVQASAADAAVARVVTSGPEYEGHTLQLPCRECGRRAVPPADAVDSPPIPFERAAVLRVTSAGFVITATCTACSGPLISRVLDEEYAQFARSLGAIDGERAEADLARALDTL